MRGLSVTFPILLSALLPLPAAAQPPPSFDALSQEALKSWEVPGAAVVVVQNDRVIFLKGFGVRDLASKKPVTAETVFPLGSCTKAFTTAALAMLVDDGKLDWDDPVRKHLPWFHLRDPLADENVTLRDLVTHRTGLAGHDLLWYRSPWKQEEIVRRIGLVKPSKSFRSSFQYQSIMFTAAGLAAGSAGKSSWQEIVQKRICDPLEMTGACFTTEQALRAADVAGPHGKNEAGKVTAVPRFAMDEPNPAGSLHASARDLGKWLRFQLGGGVYQGKRLVGAAALAETHTPQFALRMDEFTRAVNPFTLQMSYGLAWVVQDYRGQLLVSHTGVIDGFRCHIQLLPNAKTGVAVLSNLHGTRMNLALGLTIVDQLIGAPYKDWHTYYQGLVKQEEADRQARIQKELAKRKPGTRPTHELAAYAGDYEDPAYGTCRVLLENGALVWQWSAFRCPLEHFHDDTFLATKVLPTPNDFIGLPQPVFQLDKEGGVCAVTVIGVTFKRK